jgi:RHS repeat-associated protein
MDHVQILMVPSGVVTPSTNAVTPTNQRAGEGAMAMKGTGRDYRAGKRRHGKAGNPQSIVRLALAAAIAGCMSPVMAQTANTKTTYSYDALDRVTQVTDPSGLNTTYQYDGLSDPTSLTSPDTGVTAQTFDAAGNVLTGTDANGNTVTYTYDAQDRRLSTSYADSTQNITYIYDEPNNVTGCTTSYPIGHLTHVVENAVTTSFCYNAQGYVIQKSQAVNGHTDVTTYTRSPGGKILSITYPSGNQVNYSYDADGRVNGVTATTSSGTSTMVSNVTYLPFGPVSGYTLGNGQAVTRTYDANYRLTDLTSPAFSLHVARDAMGDITAVGNSAGANPATETYSYDPLYRLTAITEAGGSTLESVTYNPTGDRLSKTGSGLATGAYSYNTNTHQLTATGNAARTVDANGNTTAISQAGSTYGFGYNARNRMTVAQLNQSTIASYVYNVSGERVAKTASGATERYNYGPGSQLLSEYGATNREYVYLGDIPVANLDTQGTATSVAYVTADQLGTPRAIADGSGNTVWSWTYQGNAWGEQSPTSSGYTYNLRFPGQYYDAETGINYNVNRDYDSTTGRYVESDPLGLKGGWSTYAYVGNGPLKSGDPLGLLSYIARNGNNITFNIPIAFSGGNQDQYDMMARGISSHWTGRFGKYCVTTNVIDGSNLHGFDTNYVKVLPGNGMDTADQTGGLSQTIDHRFGSWYGEPTRTDGLDYAHEGGHLMGLDEMNGPPNLMNQYNTTSDVTEHMIDEILASPVNVTLHH